MQFFVQDFRPISLIHSLCKLITKTSLRLAPHMNSLVLPNQSVFIKGRALHDNFRTVHLSAKSLHARLIPAVLLNIDIAKAFDSVSWPFLFYVLRHMCFPARWINWLSILFSSASTRILLKGMPGGRICNAHGLCQGDPLSPLLFVIAMDALNTIFRRADEARLLTPLQPRAMKYNVFLYADDVVIFLAPLTQDVRVVRAILDIFAASSGLCTNIAKCSMSPIRCMQEDVDRVQQAFPCQITPFPCKYLGVPLSIHKLRARKICSRWWTRWPTVYLRESVPRVKGRQNDSD
jgi:hypothetical protein